MRAEVLLLVGMCLFFSVGKPRSDDIGLVYGLCGDSKGTGDFERPRQTMDELSVFGTSRTSNELKSGP